MGKFNRRQTIGGLAGLVGAVFGNTVSSASEKTQADERKPHHCYWIINRGSKHRDKYEEALRPDKELPPSGDLVVERLKAAGCTGEYADEKEAGPGDYVVYLPQFGGSPSIFLHDESPYSDGVSIGGYWSGPQWYYPHPRLDAPAWSTLSDRFRSWGMFPDGAVEPNLLIIPRTQLDRFAADQLEYGTSPARIMNTNPTIRFAGLEIYAAYAPAFAGHFSDPDSLLAYAKNPEDMQIYKDVFAGGLKRTLPFATGDRGSRATLFSSYPGM